MAYRQAVGSLLVTFALGFGHPARAQEMPYAMECTPVADIDSNDMAPQLARSLRDCIDQGRFSDAMQVFFAYSVYIDFDRKRVRSEHQNDAIVDLHNWLFADYPRPVINELRFYSDALRDQDGWYFLDTCAAVVAAGPPTYLPYYLIGRGVEQGTSNVDWRVPGFDGAVNWVQSLAANGCSVG